MALKDLTPKDVRDLLGRRAFAALKDALTPRALARLWPALAPLERAACWRLIRPADVAAAAKALSAVARWEAYQASSVECAAPLLEDAPLGARSLFRAPTKREAVLLRGMLAR